jgi:hypothetical protein
MPAAIRDGQWWRLLSGCLVHVDASHLLVNLAGLLLLGRVVEACLGPLRTWLVVAAALVAGALGTVSSQVELSAGASGAVCGLFAAAVAVGARLWPSLPSPLRRGLVVLPLAVGLALLLLALLPEEVGEDGAVDHRAHLGGALAGLALGLGVRIRPRVGDIVLEAAGAEAQSSRLLVAVGMLLALAFPVAAGLAALEASRPLRLSVPVVPLAFDRALLVPAGRPARLWLPGGCKREAADPAWALGTGRTLCFDLGPAGTLLLGRRQDLLTMDDGDRLAMDLARRRGQLVRRQNGVLLAPVGRDLLWVLLAPDSILPAWEQALADLAAAARAAKLPERVPPGPGQASPGDEGPRTAGPGPETSR